MAADRRGQDDTNLVTSGPVLRRKRFDPASLHFAKRHLNTSIFDESSTTTSTKSLFPAKPESRRHLDYVVARFRTHASNEIDNLNVVDERDSFQRVLDRFDDVVEIGTGRVNIDTGEVYMDPSSVNESVRITLDGCA